MKYLKPYNEAVIDFLKPKSKEDVLNSIKNLSNEEKLVKALEYNIEWLVDDSLKKVDSHRILLKYKHYKTILDSSNKLNFTEEEKEKIDSILNIVPGVIYSDPIERMYKYLDVSLIKVIHDSLVINTRHSNYRWYINKYDKFLLVHIHREYEGNDGFLLLPKFDDLLKYLKEEGLKAKKEE